VPAPDREDICTALGTVVEDPETVLPPAKAGMATERASPAAANMVNLGIVNSCWFEQRLTANRDRMKANLQKVT
jgi:hypothetical protein